MALLSKIARLPKAIREEVNRRLDNGEPGSKILPWLNALPDVRMVLAEFFDGKEINDQNLSNWRETGYCEWQTYNERLDRTRALADMAVRLGENAGKLFAGGGAIAAGHIMELMEGLDIDGQADLLKKEPATFTELLDKLARLTKANAEAERTAFDKVKHQTAKDKLAFDREKFEVLAAKALLKHAQSKEVQSVIKGGGSNAEKIAALRAVMFPQRAKS